MAMKKSYTTYALVITSLALTSCSSSDNLSKLNLFSPAPQAQSESQPVATDKFTGTWQDSSGIISIFNHGKFATYTLDTNEKLAEGSYKALPGDKINIKLKSLVRGTVSNVECELNWYGSKLSCSSEAGPSFTLNKLNSSTKIAPSK